MNTDKLEKRISTAQDALRSFIATLLGDDAPLQIDRPRKADFDAANERSLQEIAFTGGASKEGHWAVVLETDWLPLLSKSMLGEPIEFGEPGANDLLKELAAQAYGAVRTQLASAGTQLPDAKIELMAGDEELGGHRFSPVLYEIPFQIEVGDETLSGFALVPPLSEDAGEMEAEPGLEQAVADLDSREPVTADPEAGPQAGPSSTLKAAPPPQGQRPRRTVQVQQAAFPDLGEEVIGGDSSRSGFELLAEVELEVTVELGRRSIPLADVLRLTTGSVIELEKLVGEPLEVYANGRLIAEGEAVVMDEQFGIRITNLSNGKSRAKAFL